MQELKNEPDLEEQTCWNEQWDKEKLELLKTAIQVSCINCEADGEDPFEKPDDKQKLSGNIAQAL